MGDRLSSVFSPDGTLISASPPYQCGVGGEGEKTRQTEEEVGRQHQGMDRPGVRQVSEGSGE